MNENIWCFEGQWGEACNLWLLEASPQAWQDVTIHEMQIHETTFHVAVLGELLLYSVSADNLCSWLDRGNLIDMVYWWCCCTDHIQKVSFICDRSHDRRDAIKAQKPGHYYPLAMTQDNL